MNPDADLLRDLEDPEAYPPPRPGAVEVRETHLSWVFLTDRDAWKIKKPVNFGFVDYSTPEKRLAFCREEVRLNRRLAADVYRGVEGVRRDARGYSFRREGPVAEWAVRMKRLPDEQSAAAMLTAGTLRAAALERLADLLAPFYASAAAGPEYGSTEVLAENVRENFDQVLPYVGAWVDRALFDDVRSWQEAFLARSAALFSSRVRSGRVLEGHGDLRLEHVYFPPGDPVVIDAIEFNPRFRFADAALDAAFLAMELEAREAGVLGGHFMGRFAGACQDYDFYPLLDFYLSYRAWVRAKVACFVAADPRAPEEKRRRKSAEARALFSLAAAFTRPRRGPAGLVAVGGVIGSGKSTFARELGRTVGLPAVSSDATRKFLAGLAPEARGGPELYTPDFSSRVYRELLRRADVVLGSGRGVLLDASFARAADRRDAKALAARHGVPFLFVETRAPEDVLRARLRARSGAPSVSDAREDLLEEFRERFEPVKELDPGETVELDGTGTPEGMVRALLARGSFLRPGP